MGRRFASLDLGSVASAAEPLSLKQARAIAGKLGTASKMPGTSYGLPASACIAGARLAKMPGTICSECYALKDLYLMPNVALGHRRRLAAISHPLWVEAMIVSLLWEHRGPTIPLRLKARGRNRYGRSESGWHRWHDSGDIQSVEHLRRIYEVCRRTPRIRHWLPTRELVMLREAGPPPPNLTIRVSATLIGAEIASEWPASMVHTAAPPAHAHECPAPKQEHKCGSCRACWSRDVRLVSYAKH